jgi:hypothetical protein
MASRLRSSIGTRVSFFAFQDIITSVTGILILVTLILALYVNESTPVSSEQQELKQKLAASLRELQTVSAQVAQRQTNLAALASTPDPARLHEDIRQLQDQLTAQSNRMSALEKNQAEQQAAAAVKAEKLGLTDLRERAGTVRAQIESQQITNAALIQTVAETERQQKELKEKIEKSEREVWILPGPPTGKQPVYVVVSSTKITCDRANQPGAHREFAGARAVADFTAGLRQWARNTDYFLFYVRPSGINVFKRCSDAAKTAGFQIGYDAVEEDKQVIFSSPARQ